ncbi:hypothetical protein BCEP4_700037 [Burkholderia cepacia]|nr:hypothetical protein BCEP4_700037 [Burkholderia cepacia]
MELSPPCLLLIWIKPVPLCVNGLFFVRRLCRVPAGGAGAMRLHSMLVDCEGAPAHETHHPRDRSHRAARDRHGHDDALLLRRRRLPCGKGTARPGPRAATRR